MHAFKGLYAAVRNDAALRAQLVKRCYAPGTVVTLGAAEVTAEASEHG